MLLREQMKRKKVLLKRTNVRQRGRMNNLSNFLAYEIAPLLKSVHLRISGTESCGHTNDPSSTLHY